MGDNTFPVYTADAIVNFYRTEVLTGQEAKHFNKSDLAPAPKVTLTLTAAGCCLHYDEGRQTPLKILAI